MIQLTTYQWPLSHSHKRQRWSSSNSFILISCNKLFFSLIHSHQLCSNSFSLDVTKCPHSFILISCEKPFSQSLSSAPIQMVNTFILISCSQTGPSHSFSSVVIKLFHSSSSSAVIQLVPQLPISCIFISWDPAASSHPILISCHPPVPVFIYSDQLWSIIFLQAFQLWSTLVQFLDNSSTVQFI